MPPTFVSSGAGNGDGTISLEFPVPIPPARQAGDMIVVAVITDTDIASITPTGGFTAFTDSPVTDAPTGDSKLFCWWKEATGSEPVHYLFTMSSPTKTTLGVTLYTNAGAIDQQEMSANTTASRTAVTPDITPGDTDTLVVCIFAADLNATDEFSVVAPLTKRTDFAASPTFTRIAFADAPASDLAQLYPDDELYPSDVLYPLDGTESDLHGTAHLAASVPMMTAIFSILEGDAAPAASTSRRMLMGVGV